MVTESIGKALKAYSFSCVTLKKNTTTEVCEVLMGIIGQQWFIPICEKNIDDLQTTFDIVTQLPCCLWHGNNEGIFNKHGF